MSVKQKDEFFNELDKTADLLRTFKPSVEQPKEMGLEEIENLYNALEKGTEEEAKLKLERQKKMLERTSEMDKLEKIINEKLEKEKLKSSEEESSKMEKIEPEKEEIKKTVSEVTKKTNEESNDETSSKEIKKSVEGSAAPKQKRELTREEKIARLKAKKRKEALAAKKKALEENSSNVEKAVKVDTKKEEKKATPKKTKRRIKKGVFELIFCGCSFLFMIVCICIYGSRLIKYYKIYNPKNDSGEVLALLTTEIAKNSSIVYEGEGLYMQGGDYVYKGVNVNNYVEFSNLLWRIVKVNADGTMDIMLDDYINVLPFSKEYVTYLDSDIHKWLNEYFIEYLNGEYLSGTKICLDIVDDLNNYSCTTSNEESYVRLLSVKEYLNSKVDNLTYMGNEESSLWLHSISSEGAWQVNGNSLSIALEERALGVKPVVTLKVGIALLDGEGTKESPYKIEKEEESIAIGDYVKLGDDTYVVYNTKNDKLSLALNDYLPNTYRFDIGTNLYNLDTLYSLAYYLNNTYYNSLSYKDMILESEWNIGSYVTTYKDIEESKVQAKVGLLSLEDLKFENELSDYFLLNGVDTFSYLYGNELVVSKPNISRKIRPCITIQNGNVVSGDGSIESPYVMEE